MPVYQLKQGNWTWIWGNSQTPKCIKEKVTPQEFVNQIPSRERRTWVKMFRHSVYIYGAYGDRTPVSEKVIEMCLPWKRTYWNGYADLYVRDWARLYFAFSRVPASKNAYRLRFGLSNN